MADPNNFAGEFDDVLSQVPKVSEKDFTGEFDDVLQPIVQKQYAQPTPPASPLEVAATNFQKSGPLIRETPSEPPTALISKPLVELIPKLPEEGVGRVLSFPARWAMERIESQPEEQPVSPALMKVAGSMPSDKAIAITTGIQHATADLANFFTSPLGIATMGMGALPAGVARAVSAAFAVQMASDMPMIASELGAELGKPEDQRDYNKIANLTTSALAQSYFATHAGKSAIEPQWVKLLRESKHLDKAFEERLKEHAKLVGTAEGIPTPISFGGTEFKAPFVPDVTMPQRSTGTGQRTVRVVNPETGKTEEKPMSWFTHEQGGKNGQQSFQVEEMPPVEPGPMYPNFGVFTLPEYPDTKFEKNNAIWFQINPDGSRIPLLRDDPAARQLIPRLEEQMQQATPVPQTPQGLSPFEVKKYQETNRKASEAANRFLHPKDEAERQAAMQEYVALRMSQQEKTGSFTPEGLTFSDDILQWIDKHAAAATQRLLRGELELGSGLPGLNDYGIVGAAKLARGLRDFSRWSADMVRTFGEKIRPHLADIWTMSHQTLAPIAELQQRKDAQDATAKRLQPEGREQQYPGTPLRQNVQPNAPEIRQEAGGQAGSGNRPEQGTGGPGQAQAVNAVGGLPDWVREALIARGLDPKRPLNDIDLGNPSIQEALSFESPENIAKMGLVKNSKGVFEFKSADVVQRIREQLGVSEEAARRLATVTTEKDARAILKSELERKGYGTRGPDPNDPGATHHNEAEEAAIDESINFMLDELGIIMSKPMPEATKPKVEDWRKDLEDAMQTVRRRISIREDIEGAVGDVRKQIVERDKAAYLKQLQAIIDEPDWQKKLELDQQLTDALFKPSTDFIKHVSKDDQRALFQKSKEAMDSLNTATEKHIASQLPSDAKAVRLVNTKDPKRYVIVSKSTYPEYKDQWQATRFDENGPIGHFNAPSLVEAIQSLYGMHTKTVGLPWGSRGEYKIERVEREPDVFKTTVGAIMGMQGGDFRAFRNKLGARTKEFQQQLAKEYDVTFLETLAKQAAEQAQNTGSRPNPTEADLNNALGDAVKAQFFNEVLAFAKERQASKEPGTPPAAVTTKDKATPVVGDNRPAAEPVISPEHKGNPFEVSTPRREGKVTGHFELLELGQLITSDNLKYNQALQGRNRATIASVEQINNISQNIDPAGLGESLTSDMGAPLINTKNEVLSGNGRTMALRLRYATEPTLYKNWLIQNAAKFGLDPQVVAKMERPVLARRVTNFGDFNEAQFADLSNRQQVANMTVGEKARSDAMWLERNPNVLELFRPGENGDLLVESNRGFNQAFINGVVDKESMQSAKGVNEKELKARIKNALLTIIVGHGNPNLVSALVESASEIGVGNAVNGLQQATPILMKLRGTKYDIRPQLSQAISDLVDIRRSGQKVEDFLGTQTLFGDSNRTAESDALLYALYKASSAKQVVNALTKYVSSALQAAEDAKSGGLFGDKPLSPAEILKIINSNEANFRPENVSAGEPAPAGQPPAKPENAPPVAGPEPAGAASAAQPPEAAASLTPKLGNHWNERGALKLVSKTGMTEAEAKEFIKNYRAGFSERENQKISSSIEKGRDKTYSVNIWHGRIPVFVTSDKFTGPAVAEYIKDGNYIVRSIEDQHKQYVVTPGEVQDLDDYAQKLLESGSEIPKDIINLLGIDSPVGNKIRELEHEKFIARQKASQQAYLRQAGIGPAGNLPAAGPEAQPPQGVPGVQGPGAPGPVLVPENAPVAPAPEPTRLQTEAQANRVGKLNLNDFDKPDRIYIKILREVTKKFAWKTNKPKYYYELVKNLEYYARTRTQANKSNSGTTASLIADYGDYGLYDKIWSSFRPDEIKNIADMLEAMRAATKLDDRLKLAEAVDSRLHAAITNFKIADDMNNGKALKPEDRPKQPFKSGDEITWTPINGGEPIHGFVTKDNPADVEITATLGDRSTLQSVSKITGTFKVAQSGLGIGEGKKRTRVVRYEYGPYIIDPKTDMYAGRKLYTIMSDGERREEIISHIYGRGPADRNKELVQKGDYEPPTAEAYLDLDKYSPETLERVQPDEGMERVAAYGKHQAEYEKYKADFERGLLDLRDEKYRAYLNNEAETWENSSEVGLRSLGKAILKITQPLEGQPEIKFAPLPEKKAKAPKPAAPPPPAEPAFALEAQEAQESKPPPKAPAAPKAQQASLFGAEAPSAKPAAVEQRPLTKEEQKEFKSLSLKLREFREAGGPRLTNEETQRYEHLAALAGQQTFGFAEQTGPLAMKSKLRALEREYRDLLLEGDSGPGKKERNERKSVLDQQIRELRDAITEGQGEMIYTSPRKMGNNGYEFIKEYRIRQLDQEETMSRWPSAADRDAMWGKSLTPFVAESRRVMYDENGKVIPGNHWFADGYGETAADAEKYARERRWKDIPKKSEKPAAPVEEKKPEISNVLVDDESAVRKLSDPEIEKLAQPIIDAIKAAGSGGSGNDPAGMPIRGGGVYDEIIDKNFSVFQIAAAFKVLRSRQANITLLRSLESARGNRNPINELLKENKPAAEKAEAEAPKAEVQKAGKFQVHDVVKGGLGHQGIVTAVLPNGKVEVDFSGSRSIVDEQDLTKAASAPRVFNEDLKRAIKQAEKHEASSAGFISADKTKLRQEIGHAIDERLRLGDKEEVGNAFLALRKGDATLNEFNDTLTRLQRQLGLSEMEIEYEPPKAKESKAAAPAPSEQPPVESVPEGGTPAAGAEPQRYQLKGQKSPQTFSLIEKLPATPVEIANGEQPVRVKNERTGEELTVMEGDLIPVKTKSAEEKAAAKESQKAAEAKLNEEFKKYFPKGRPDEFTADEKRGMIDREKAKRERRKKRDLSPAPESMRPLELSDKFGNEAVLIPPDTGADLFPVQHATPYDFERFRLDKIGTGEGAQVYGWGLYFAENPETIKKYVRDIGDKHNTQGQRKYLEEYFKPGRKINQTYDSYDEVLAFNWNGGNWSVDVRGYLRDPFRTDEWTPQYTRNHSTRPTALQMQEAGVQAGNVFTVDVADDALLLELDKPMKDQDPRVLAALAKAGYNFDPSVIDFKNPNNPLNSGRGFYTMLENANRGQTYYLNYDEIAQHYQKNKRVPSQLVEELLDMQDEYPLKRALREFDTDEQRKLIDEFTSVDPVLGHSLENMIYNLAAKATSMWLDRHGIHGAKYFDEGSRDRYFVDKQLITKRPIWDDQSTLLNNLGKEPKTEEIWVVKDSLGSWTSSKEFNTFEKAKAYADSLNPKSKTYNYVIWNEGKLRITHKNGEVMTPEEFRNLQISEQAKKAPSSGAPTIEMRTSEDLRRVANDPASKLSKEHQHALNKLADTGLVEQLPGMTMFVQDFIGDNVRGMYTHENRYVRFTRFSDADVPIHEFWHDVQHFLQPEDRQFISRLRLMQIDELMGKIDKEILNPDSNFDPEQLREQKAQLQVLREQQLSSDIFLAKKYYDGNYHLANEYEFFTWLMTKRSMELWNRPEANTFREKIRRIVERIKNWWADAFGLSNYEDTLFRQLISGNYDFLPEQSQRYINTEGKHVGRDLSLPLDKREYERKKIYRELGTQSGTIGGYRHLTEVQERLADQMNISKRARAVAGLNKNRDMTDIALQDGGRVNYYDARDNATTLGEKNEVIHDAYQKIIMNQHQGLRLRKKQRELREVVTSQSFRNAILKAAEKRDKADMLEEARRSFVEQTAGAAGRIKARLQAMAVSGAMTDQLQSDLQRVEKLPEFSTAISNRIDDIVNILSQSDEGISLLLGAGRLDGTDIANRYWEAFPESARPQEGSDMRAYVDLASSVLAANRDLRNQLTSFHLLNSELVQPAEVNAAASKVAQDLMNNPSLAVQRLARRSANMGEKSARAEAVWLALHRPIQRKLAEYNALDEAVRLHEAVRQDPEWRQYVNDVIRDLGDPGAYVSDEVLDKMQQEYEANPGKVARPIDRVFFNLSGNQTLYSPTGEVFNIDMGWTPQTVMETQNDLARLQQQINEWLDPMINPQNANDPARGYWQERQKLIESTLRTAMVWNPSGIKQLIGTGSMGIPEVFYQGLALPQAKITFIAQKNFDRYYTQGKGWYVSNYDLVRSAVRKARASHGYNELQAKDYQRSILNQIAWEYRNGREVRAGDILNGNVITPEDISLLKTMGRTFSELYNLMWNTGDLAGATDVMEKARVLDEFTGGAWGIRKAMEIGIQKGTTLPRTFSSHGRDLARNIHQIIEARRRKIERAIKSADGNDPEGLQAIKEQVNEDYRRALENFLNHPERYRDFVLGWLRQRNSKMYRKPSEFEEQYRSISEEVASGHPDAPMTMEELYDRILSKLDEGDYESVRDTVLGEITNLTEKFHDLTLQHGESDLDVRISSGETAFNRAWTTDVGPAYFYDFGAIDAGELRGYGSDMMMFGWQRLSRSMNALLSDMDRAIADLKSPGTVPEIRQQEVKAARLAQRMGQDFRTLQALENKRLELHQFINNLGVWSNVAASHAEGINLKYGSRFMSLAIGAALSGPRTLARISGITGGGSAVKMGNVAYQSGFGKLRSYPAAFVSALISAFRNGMAHTAGWYHPEREQIWSRNPVTLARNVAATFGDITQGKGKFVHGIPVQLAINLPKAIQAFVSGTGKERLWQSIEAALQDTTDAQFSAMRFWMDQKALGMTPNTTMGERLANILAEPMTKGGVYRVPEADTRAGRMWQALKKQTAIRALSLAEAVSTLAASRFPSGGYNVNYDSVGRIATWYMDVLASHALRTFETYEKLGQLDRFNFENLQDPKNSLAPWEVLPTFTDKIRFADPSRLPAWARPNSTNLHFARELFATSTDVDLQDLMLRYWKRLASTPREERRNVLFMAPEEIDATKALQRAEARARGVISRFVEQTHHAAPSNRPFWMIKNYMLQAFLPFVGWTSQTLTQLNVYFGRALFAAGRGGKQFDSHTGLLIAAGMTAAAAAAAAFLGGDSEIRFLRSMDRLVNKKNSTLKTIDEAESAVEKAEIAIHNMTAFIPVLNSSINSLVGSQAYRGQYGFQAFALDKINTLLDYTRGVVRTHDPTYGLDRLAITQFPLSEPVIENLGNREGFQNNRNAVRAMQKFGPEDLVARRASTGISLPSQLTPYKQALVEAIYSGNQAAVQKAYNDFVRKAGEIGRPEPDKIAAQTFSTLNPYREAFGTLLTEDQRSRMINHMGDYERNVVLQAERNYSNAAATIGKSANFSKEDAKTAREGDSGESGGGTSTSPAVAAASAASRSTGYGGGTGLGGSRGGLAPSSGGFGAGGGGGMRRISLGSGRGMGMPRLGVLTGSGVKASNFGYRPPSASGATTRRLSLKPSKKGIKRPKLARLKPRSGKSSNTKKRLSLKNLGPW